VFYHFWAGSITVIASSKQKDGELDLDWGLRGVEIVVEYAVVVDLADDAIEGVGVNM
jgi:hypothetical protein